MLRLIRALTVGAALLLARRRVARLAATVSTPEPRAPERLLGPVTRRRGRAAVFLAVAPVLVIAGACSSGGGGGTGSTTTPIVTSPVSPPSPPPPPPPPPPPVTPSTTSAEYTRSYGLAAIRVDAAYSAGATGTGQLIAVIDSGVNSAQADLVGAVSSASTDIITARNQPIGADPHATYVAGIIASQFNGFGTIGVAYNAKILSIRADQNVSCSSDCTLNDSDIAKGIDYAVANGAKIINLSVGGTGPSGSAFQAAMLRAVQAGVVFAISAGNEGAANPDYPAAYATDPRFAGSVIAVGSVDVNKALSSFSNKAGTSAAGYVTAPGDKVVSSCDGASCYILSGTSFSAPHVAGALALLMQAFPNLTGKQAVSLLLTTSDDLGATGVDTTYGYGEIDLARAFAPAGTVTTQSAGGATVVATTASGVRLGQAFGDAVRRTSGLQTIGFDSYDRRFSINLAARYHPMGAASLQDWITPSPRTEATDLSTDQAELHLAASRGQPRSEAEQRFGLRSERETPSDVLLSMQSGRFNFTAWRGEGGIGAAGGLAGGQDAFAAMARPTSAARTGVGFGFGEFSYEAGAGERRQLLGIPTQDPSTYQVASFSRARGALLTRLSFGTLSEPAGPLGSMLPAGVQGLSLPARTTFTSAHLDWRAGGDLLVSADGSVGSTRAAGLVGLDGPVLSSSWKIMARTLCDVPGCTGFSAALEQPVRIEAGRFTATLADVPTDYFAPLTFSTRSFSAAPSGRELDLRLSATRDTAHAGFFLLQAVAMHDEGQVARAPLNLGLIGAWRARW